LLRASTGTERTPLSPFHIWLSPGEWLFWGGERWGICSPYFICLFRGWGLVLAVWVWGLVLAVWVWGLVLAVWGWGLVLAVWVWGLVLAVWGWGLVLAVRTPLRKVVLIWLASRWGEIAARILRGGYADAQGMLRR